MNAEWIIIEWIKRYGDNKGLAIIAPIDHNEVMIGLAVFTEIPNKKYKIIGELQDE